MTNAGGSHDPQARLRKMLDLNPSPRAITIYVDADACPVKQEVYRVAERHALKGVDLKVFVVSNSPIAVPRDIFVGGRPDAKPGSTFAGRPLIERVVVGAGMDEADNWIAERANRGAIVVTADVPLASRCVKAGAAVIAPNGKLFTEESIGMTLATRNLMDSLRSAGEITGGPKPFAPRDRSNFLSALDQALVRLKRDGFG
jgi:uncharacterized protein YaiI (UPF0178 family)